MNQVDYLLACLTEEGCEVGQAGMKALRFGLIDKKPGFPETNLDRLAAELNDLRAVERMLIDAGILPEPSEAAISAKIEKVRRFMRVSASLGRLE